MEADERIKRYLGAFFDLKQKRGFSLKRLHENQKAIRPLVDSFPFGKERLSPLLDEKEKLIDYSNIKAECRELNSLLRFVRKLLKKKEFLQELYYSKVDVNALKHALEVDIAWVEDVLDLNSKIEKEFKTIRRLALSDDKEALEKKLKFLDSWQYGMDVHLQKLEDSIKEKVDAIPSIPAHGGIWKKVVVSAIALAIGFNVVTATLGEKFDYVGGVAYAGEVVQYKSVNQILAPIKNKVFVNKDTYLQEVAKSKKAVVFFYDGENDYTGISHAFAEVWARVFKKYPGIKLICYDYDKENLSGKFYIDQFGITGTPFYSFIVNGKIVFKHKGGPKKDRIAHEIKVQEKNMVELSNM